MAEHPRVKRILISNDDGIDAPGIKLLEKIAHQLTPDVWVVARRRRRRRCDWPGPRERRPTGPWERRYIAAA